MLDRVCFFLESKWNFLKNHSLSERLIRSQAVNRMVDEVHSIICRIDNIESLNFLLNFFNIPPMYIGVSSLLYLSSTAIEDLDEKEEARTRIAH